MKDADLFKTVEAQDPLVRELLPENLSHGVLIPLKTTLEIRDGHAVGQGLITRVPIKAASGVIAILRDLIPEDVVKGMPHLRRCAKPCDLPVHLKTHFMNESIQSKQVHTGKSPLVYVMLGIDSLFDIDELFKALRSVEGVVEEEIFVASIPIPLLPPTSQNQAALWGNEFWPTVYRKNNPLGPHPSMVARATEEIAGDAAIWMALALRVARKTKAKGLGEPVGACIIQRTEENTKVVALAADARWHHQESSGCTGDPMAHAVLRAISMVARKLVRGDTRDRQQGQEREQQQNRRPQQTASPVLFDPFQDEPLFEEERRVYEEDHPSLDGYLCHGLELYLTHEPCVMCSMSILHSRMGKVIFADRMPLTGGIGSEDRMVDPDRYPGMSEKLGGGRGLGLFWRRELNWSLLGWEWEPSEGCQPDHLPPHFHA